MNRVFAFWFGGAELSEQRGRCRDSLQNTECEIVFVTEGDLPSYILAEFPLHPAFTHLSAVHKSDYLRAYFMHHYGGGYADLKLTSESWRPAFAALEASDAVGAGYTEVRGGFARFHKSRVAGKRYFLDQTSSSLKAWAQYKFLHAKHRQAIGNCAFIFKPRTEFTRTWLSLVDQRLGILQEALSANPASHVRDAQGRQFDGVASHYPVPWTFLQGDILGPLSIRHRAQLLHTVPRPSFENYQ